jgi:uncharacterized protein YndB with AHSA1/START domain
MPEIAYKFNINATPRKVYEALTESKHIAEWWTPDCTADRNVGGYAKFEFKGPTGKLDGYSRVRIEKLVPGKLVEWKCLEQDFQGVNDWIGTTIRFALAPDSHGGTEIDFAHTNWKDTGGCYGSCTDGWGHVLKTSLKNYLETGKGEPYLAHIAKDAAARDVHQ